MCLIANHVTGADLPTCQRSRHWYIIWLGTDHSCAIAQACEIALFWFGSFRMVCPHMSRGWLLHLGVYAKRPVYGLLAFICAMRCDLTNRLLWSFLLQWRLINHLHTNPSRKTLNTLLKGILRIFEQLFDLVTLLSMCALTLRDEGCEFEVNFLQSVLQTHLLLLEGLSNLRVNCAEHLLGLLVAKRGLSF